MKKYNAVVIGCGSIGALKPIELDSQASKNVLTFANAFYRNDRINLVGLIDLDHNKMVDACTKWDCHMHFSLSDIREKINIIAVCVNTEDHFKVITGIKKELGYCPEIIIAEKPLGLSQEECQDIIDYCDENNIILMVDYIRRYNHHLRSIRSTIRALWEVEGATIYSCRIAYNRGLYRDGCHAIDFCNYIFGSFIDGYRLEGPAIIDLDDTDPTYSYHLIYEGCKNVVMTAIDGRYCSMFEFDIINGGRIRLLNNFAKIEIYDLEKDGTYGSYSRLCQVPFVSIDTNLANTLTELVDNAVAFLNCEDVPHCTGTDALQVHKIINHIRGRA